MKKISPKDTPRARMLQGALMQMPTMIGGIPFGMVIGMLGASGGLGFWKTMVLTFFPMSGTVFMVSLQMSKSAAPFAIILVTIAIMNMRLLVYSASIAPWLPGLTWPWKLLVPFALGDNTYAFAMVEFNRNPDRPNRRWHLMGGGIWSLFLWTASSAAGYFAGAAIPASWGLEFAATLTFLALLVQSITSRAALVAAVVGGVVAIAAWALPLKLGAALAILAGMTAGTLFRKAQH